jgi:hypothetical protein
MQIPSSSERASLSGRHGFGTIRYPPKSLRPAYTNSGLYREHRDWVQLVYRPLFGLLYQPRVIDEYGEFGGMKIGRGNRSTRRKYAPLPLCPPQIPHDLTWDRTRASAMGSRRLTAWAMARPHRFPCCKKLNGLPRGGLDLVAKRKIPAPPGNWTPIKIKYNVCSKNWLPELIGS